MTKPIWVVTLSHANPGREHPLPESLLQSNSDFFNESQGKTTYSILWSEFSDFKVEFSKAGLYRGWEVYDMLTLN